MPKPAAQDQKPFRRTSRSNSPSASSIATVRPSGSLRSRSDSRMTSKASNASSDESKPASSLNRISSSGGSKHADATGHYSRWSHSSNSSHATNEHRRHSSFSKRFSFGSSSLGNSQTAPTRRTPSPTKKRRPADIQIAQVGPRAVKSTTSGGQLALPGSLVAHKLFEDGPRTPLLYMGQISAADDGHMDSHSRFTQKPPDDSFSGASFSSKQRHWEEVAVKPLQPTKQNFAQAEQRNESESEKPTRDSFNKASSPEQSKSRKEKDKDKKALLSRALQRANEAVNLDNSQDYLGAVETYEEACEYLTQVLNRTSGEEDRRKLSTIRTTYSTRIQELQQLDSQWRELDSQNVHTDATDEAPEAAKTGPSLDGSIDEDAAPAIGIAVASPTPANQVEHAYTSDEHDLHLERDVLSVPRAFQDQSSFDPWAESLSSNGLSPNQPISTDTNRLAPPTGSDMPHPLSPRRPPPPVPTGTGGAAETSEPSDANDPRRESHLIGAAAGSYGTWLDNGLESPGIPSRSSSHHSVSSLNELRRRHLRVHSTSTEAEFDAALDAAVEAAYNEGYEPYTEADTEQSDDYLARTAMVESPTRPDEFFEQRQSIIAAANAYVAQLDHHSSAQFSDPRSSLDSEEEERLLDEATHEYLADNRSPESRAKTTSARQPEPRESDSSTSSGRTWGSSTASSGNTGATSLTTVNENATTPASNFNKQQQKMPPPAPPPTGALPMIPPKGKAPLALPDKQAVPQTLPTLTLPQSPSVQERRSFTGQGTKRLKIETAIGPKPAPPTSEPAEQLALTIPKRSQVDPEAPAVPPKLAPSSDLRPSPDASSQGQPASSTFRLISSPFPTPFQCKFPDDISSTASPPTSGLNSALSNDSSSIRPSPQSASPINPFHNRPIDRGLLKSQSNHSLRQKGLVTTPDSYEVSPATPMSLNFTGPAPLTRAPPSNTSVPTLTSMDSTAPSVHSLNLFANEIHASDASNHAESRVPYPPRPLEPCPTSDLLRPFWLMRRFYQTLAHPRGGYLTNKVFIPREVWKVKNVKLKNVDDKIANCDLLTAALLKLGSVDTLDADAVLEELQTFESVLEQAQANLSKKLGSDVGVQSVSSLFKDAPVSATSPSSNARTAATGDTSSMGNNNAGKSNSKSYLSWRRLRSKNSSANLSGGSFPATKETTSRESVTMSTVPMTDSWPGSTSNTRGVKRDASTSAGEVKADGPNASYMSALARLCDAVQVLDQIARQVEDPGLKHSSPTHVGLELSSRHAAEFFGFYVCRFVLQDIMMLAEKFVKRASEWVLA